MSANIDYTGGRANFASLAGTSVWWGQGTELQPGQSIDTWVDAANLGWTAEMRPAYVQIDGVFTRVDNANFVQRSDSKVIISPTSMSDGYKPHQNRDLVTWAERYLSVDPRFQMRTMGSLKGGAIIWILVDFNGETTVGGSKHLRRLLLTTTFDGSGATKGKATTICVVCNNTLDAALASRGGEVSIRHNTHFDPAKASKDLSAVVATFDRFKAMGDAMSQVEMSHADVVAFFKQLLAIPAEAKPEDISTRKMNQFSDLCRDYQKASGNEAEAGSTWAAMNAVTRYVDHSRSTRGGADPAEARVLSSQFGSGAAMKAQAWNLLLPRIKDKVPVAA